MIVCATLLACIIHESWGFVDTHPQQIDNFCCGFRQGALHPLRASLERRPEEAVVEVPRQARDMSLSNGPKGGLSWSREGSMKHPG